MIALLGNFIFRNMQLNGIDKTVRLFRDSEVNNSLIGEYSYVGECSRVRNCEIGRFVKIDRNNFVAGTQIGDYSYTGTFDMIFNSIIGKFCSISYGVTIGPPEHDYKRLSMHPMIYDRFYNIFNSTDLIRNNKYDKELVIGNDVWIGCNSTILRGVKIGNGAVIGANSLVKHDVPPYAIVVGAPAHIIKFRFDDDVIMRLNQIQWWNWEVEKIRTYKTLFLKENINMEDLKNF